MGVFDCLIDEGREPIVGMEYIYNLNMAWPHEDGKKSMKSIDVENGIIVTDVVAEKTEDGYHLGYDFTIKKTGQRCHRNYAWAFWENTPENLVKVEKFREEKAKLDEQERLVDELREDIAQLTIKKNRDGDFDEK